MTTMAGSASPFARAVSHRHSSSDSCHLTSECSPVLSSTFLLFLHHCAFSIHYAYHYVSYYYKGQLLSYVIFMLLGSLDLTRSWKNRTCISVYIGEFSYYEFRKTSDQAHYHRRASPLRRNEAGRFP